MGNFASKVTFEVAFIEEVTSLSWGYLDG